MNSADIVPFDLYRMFIGDVPLLFSLEIVFRTIFLYAYTVFILRFVSHRTVGQLSLVEFLLVIALGSAVGDPMFYPEVPLLHGMIVIASIVFFSRFLTYIMNNNEQIENAIEGSPIEVISDGYIVSKKLEKVHISIDELFEWLRTQGISSMSEVQYAYVEKSGSFTVFKYDKTKQRPGLSFVPPWDISAPNEYETGTQLEVSMPLGCRSCGEVCDFSAGIVLPPCPHCQKEKWVDAVNMDVPKASNG